MSIRPTVSAMMQTFDQHVADQLKATPEVITTEGEIDISDLYINVPKWRKYPKVTCVFADLAGSTSLRRGKWEASTASIYESAVKPAVIILDDFGADFIDVQGDAAFGLFVGDYSRNRAICAGITIKTFGAHVLLPALEVKWPHDPPRRVLRLESRSAISLRRRSEFQAPRTMPPSGRGEQSIMPLSARSRQKRTR